MSDDEADPELLALLRAHLGLGPRSTKAPPETNVLRDAQFIVDNSVDVALDMRGTQAAAAQIWKAMEGSGYGCGMWREWELHPTRCSDAPEEEMLGVQSQELVETPETGLDELVETGINDGREKQVNGYDNMHTDPRPQSQEDVYQGTAVLQHQDLQAESSDSSQSEPGEQVEDNPGHLQSDQYESMQLDENEEILPGQDKIQGVEPLQLLELPPIEELQLGSGDDLQLGQDAVLNGVESNLSQGHEQRSNDVERTPVPSLSDPEKLKQARRQLIKEMRYLRGEMTDEETTDFIWTVDLLNFSFWAEDEGFAVEWRGKTWEGYWGLCAAIWRALVEGT
jgi:hypothetical protein